MLGFLFARKVYMDTDNIALTNIQFKWSVGLNVEILLDTLTKAFKNAKTYSFCVSTFHSIQTTS